jgi:hypothetical protein
LKILKSEKIITLFFKWFHDNQNVNIENTATDHKIIKW